MNILAFDTCLDKTYVTYSDGEKFSNRVILSTGENYHSAFLISTIVSVLKENGLTPSDIDLIVTDIGPGSFTGIRACTTVARMLGQQLNVNVIGISSLEILSRINSSNDLVVLDARKNKAYVYDNKILGAVELEKVEEIVQGRFLITDNSMIEKFGKIAKDAISYQQSEYQLGEILAKIGIEKLLNSENVDWKNLKPLYIQPPPVFGR